MNKKYIIAFAVVFIPACTLFNRVDKNITTIDEYKEVADLFNNADASTLITFDVDDTLITAHDVTARDVHYPIAFIVKAAMRYPWLVMRSEWERIGSLMFAQSKRFVFDPIVIKLIRRALKKDASVIALTSMQTGRMGVIPSMQEWRAHMLAQMGIDLSGQFEDHTFVQFNSPASRYPCLYQGVLCASHEPKGKVLGAFLDYADMKPSQIISFDDNRKALRSIGQECARRGIEFKGYLYLGADRVMGDWHKRFDLKRAMVQLDYLVRYGRWVPDTLVSV